MAFPLTPMIDMVFLLLIFFMLTTKITKEKLKLDVKLPIASAAKTPDDWKGREIINIDSEGALFIGERPTDIPGLKAHLLRRIKDQPGLRIYVRADKTTHLKEIRRIMQTCAEAGAIEVIFGTYRSSR